MAKKPDVKKQLEAIFGEELVQLIKIVQPVATSTVSVGTITEKSLLAAFPPTQCFTFPQVLDVAGSSATGSNGTKVFRLNDFRCPSGEIFTSPVNVVATPVSSTPCYLTVVHSFVNNGSDVEIKVSTWDAGGAAAPGVVFDWRCRVAVRGGTL